MIDTAEIDFSAVPQLSQQALDGLDAGDAMPAIFEWYQQVGLTIHYVASISDKSPAFKLLDPSHWAILRGLLQRCCRLMLANMALTHQGTFGETAKIIDRCIFETAVKTRWLCATGEFKRYLATSLRPERDFKHRIKEDIAGRGGEATAQQSRMLASIERHLWLAGVTWDDVTSQPKLPPLNVMISKLDLDPIVYIVGQQLGSHAVHAGWPSLLDDYIRVTDTGEFELRDHDVKANAAQYLATIFHVLDAAIDIVRFAFCEPWASDLINQIQELRYKFELFYRTHLT